MIPNTSATHQPDTSAAHSLRDELRNLLQLALPVVVVQVGLMLMGTVDTIMTGHFSRNAMSATALGNVYYVNVTILAMGILMALDPIVSQSVGAQDQRGITYGVQRGVALAVVLAALTAIPLLPAEQVLRLLRQPDEIVALAGDYVRICIPGTLPFLLFVVFRQTMQALRLMRPVLATILLANVANALLNWVLIYGELGFPSMGARGSAIASTLSRWIMFALILRAGWPQLRAHLSPLAPGVFATRPLLAMLRLGAPIGVQMQLEFGAFAVLALLMGYMGTTEMAAHQAAISLASMTFMVPLGVGAAAAVLVGHGVGRGSLTEVRSAALAALALGGGFMAVSALTMLLAPGLLARVYTSDAEVAALAALLIPVAGVFQVFDGLQAVAVGVLRGMGDTLVPMLINVLAFWFVGVPLCVFLAFRTPLGPLGLWWGMVAGLLAVAGLLLWRVRVRLRRGIHRVAIDG